MDWINTIVLVSGIVIAFFAGKEYAKRKYGVENGLLHFSNASLATELESVDRELQMTKADLEKTLKPKKRVYKKKKQATI